MATMTQPKKKGRASGSATQPAPSRSRNPMPATASTAPISHEARKHRRTQAARDYEKSGDASATAAKFGVTVAWLKYACMENGVPFTTATTGQPSSSRTGALTIIAALLAGKRQAEIAASLGVSRQRISAVAKAAEKSGLFSAAKKNGWRPKREQLKDR